VAECTVEKMSDAQAYVKKSISKNVEE